METYWKFNGVSLLETKNLNSNTIYCSFIFTELNEPSSHIAYLSLTWEPPPSAHPGRQQGTALSLFMWHQQWEGQERGWHPTEASAAFQHFPCWLCQCCACRGRPGACLRQRRWDRETQLRMRLEIQHCRDWAETSMRETGWRYKCSLLPPKTTLLIFPEMAALWVCASSVHFGPHTVWILSARHKHVPVYSLMVKQQPETNEKSKDPQGGGAVQRMGCAVRGELPALKEGETVQKEGSWHIPEATEFWGKSNLILATPLIHFLFLI